MYSGVPVSGWPALKSMMDRPWARSSPARVATARVAEGRIGWTFSLKFTR
jgi:hypothetical protein